MPENLLSAAIEQLYRLDPAQFTERRSELAAAARSDGEREAAKSIAALRRPTVAAWILNQLVRSEPDTVDRLAELGNQLRETQRRFDGPRLRELTVQRRDLIDELSRRAFAIVGQPSPTVALRDEVGATLEAALADSEVIEQLGTGTLHRAVRWSGFGTEAPELSLVAMPAPTKLSTSKLSTSMSSTSKSSTKAAAPKAQRAELAKNRQAVTDARHALAQASRAVRAAADNQQRRQVRLDELTAELADARGQLDDAKRLAREAAVAKRKAEAELAKLRPVSD